MVNILIYDRILNSLQDALFSSLEAIQRKHLQPFILWLVANQTRYSCRSANWQVPKVLLTEGQLYENMRIF